MDLKILLTYGFQDLQQILVAPLFIIPMIGTILSSGYYAGYMAEYGAGLGIRQVLCFNK